jgi:hypothetical protein
MIDLDAEKKRLEEGVLKAQLQLAMLQGALLEVQNLIVLRDAPVKPPVVEPPA